jgi:adenosylhomocysteine nucleosidase
MLTLVIASHFEAQRFIKKLTKLTEDLYEGDYRVVISGTGLINMAMATTEAINKFQPTKIINLGISGAVSACLKVGSIVKAEKFKVFSSTPIPGTSHEIWEQSYPVIEQGKGATLFSSLHPVWNDEDRHKLLTLNADLLDMEGYAFARVCQSKNIDYEVYKVISDLLHKKSQDDFLNNAQLALEDLHDFFIEKYL